MRFESCRDPPELTHQLAAQLNNDMEPQTWNDIRPNNRLVEFARELAIDVVDFDEKTSVW